MIESLPATQTNDEAPWSVLHVVANHEKHVAEHLAVRSFEHYLPLYSEPSRRLDRKVALLRPLFLGYVFVRFAPEARTTLLHIPSVLHLLGDGKRETISAVEIDRIREGLAEGCVMRPHTGISVGTRVRINRDIFAGAEGTVTKLCEPCKVILRLAATEQRFSVEVDLDDLEILNP